MRLLIPSRTIHLLLTLILFILALHVQHDDAVVEATPGFWNYLFPTTIIPLPKFDGYKTKRLLGQGGFGKVYLVKSKDNGILLALKDVSASSHREELINPVKVIMHELIMTRLAQHHPYIIYPYTQNPVILSTHAYALFEYCDLGSLEDALEFPPKTQQAATLHHNVRQDAQCLFWELVHAINHIHHLGIAHRDIKPGNVLLKSPGYVKLADFGLAIQVKRQLQPDTASSRTTLTNQSVAGTNSFLPPENLEGSRNRKGALVVRKIDDNDDKSIWYDPFKVDIWMLGMTYLEMRLGSGRRPWKYAVVEEYGFHEYVRRPDRVYQRLRYQGMGSAEVRLVMKMLKIKPEERVDVWQVMDDVWFRSLDGKCRHRMPKY